MTGSEGATDFVTDADLTVTGVAGTQIVDMVNWWLRNTAALGEPVSKSIKGVKYQRGQVSKGSDSIDFIFIAF
jgi:hypothetical protein